MHLTFSQLPPADVNAKSIAAEAAPTREARKQADYRTLSAGLPANRLNAINMTAPTVMPQSAILKTG